MKLKVDVAGYIGLFAVGVFAECNGSKKETIKWEHHCIAVSVWDSTAKKYRKSQQVEAGELGIDYRCRC